MKLEKYFKIFCFVFAGVLLIQIFQQMNQQDIQWLDLTHNIGLVLMCISMGVLMSHENLTAEVSIKSIFSMSSRKYLSAVGVFAHTLGQIGLWMSIATFAAKTILYFVG